MSKIPVTLTIRQFGDEEEGTALTLAEVKVEGPITTYYEITAKVGDQDVTHANDLHGLASELWKGANARFVFEVLGEGTHATEWDGKALHPARPAPKSPPPPKYASEVDDRRPKFKHHRTLGHAKNAVGQYCSSGARGGRVFEWDGSKWVLLYDVAPGTARNQLPWRTA